MKLGVSPPPGVMLTIHGLYPQFLLAVAYIETLIEEKYGCGTRSCGMRGHSNTNMIFMSKDLYQSLWNVDNIKITPPVFKHMIELVCRYLWKCSIPSLIKEYMFHLLAQSLRILNYSEGCNGSVLPTLQPHLNLSTGLLVQLQIELKKLYEDETKGWESLSTASGVGMGIGVCDKGRLSTYFHSLLEVVLATAETKYDEKSKTFIGLLTSAGVLSSASGSAMSLGSPTSLTKKKKVKAKRDKERGGAVPKRTPTSSPRVSESDSSHSATPSSSATSSSSFSSLPTPDISSSSFMVSDSSKASLTSSKPEDFLWFQRCLTVSQIIRHLAFREKQSESFLHTSIIDAAQVLQIPSAFNRLLVITGIPNDMTRENVFSAVHKACQSNGGLDRGDVFIPLQAVSPKVRAVDKSEGKVQVDSDSSPEQTSEAAAVTMETESPPMAEGGGGIIKGTVVMSVTSKSKIENIKKSLLKAFLLDQDGIIDVPEELMTISTVNAMLVSTEPQGNDPLEEYLQSRFFSEANQSEISESGTLALIEIFHSCFIMDQRHGSDDSRHDSGFICLSKDQILQHVQENLLFFFFNNIKPPKKSLPEQIGQVLRKYGMLKSPDKEG